MQCSTTRNQLKMSLIDSCLSNRHSSVQEWTIDWPVHINRNYILVSWQSHVHGNAWGSEDKQQNCNIDDVGCLPRRSKNPWRIPKFSQYEIRRKSIDRCYTKNPSTWIMFTALTFTEGSYPNKNYYFSFNLCNDLYSTRKQQINRRPATVTDWRKLNVIYWRLAIYQYVWSMYLYAGTLLIILSPWIT